MWFLGSVFSLLLVACAARADFRAAAREKSRDDWIIDVMGLTVQGTLVPVLQVTAGVALLSWGLPEARGSVVLHPLAAFALNFVAVDYLYYWNHRLMHSDALWPIHRVHHSATSMDVFATSRNTLWTSALIVYLWLNGLALYLLADPAPYAAAATLTAAMDLWRHSPITLPATLSAWLSPWLILPEDHAQHHSTAAPHGNYGANFKLWDRLHGTALPAADPGAPMGIPTELGLRRTLLWPFP
jgi:sterol desaturase/sphingolipid hydroxylase (fatty acid hydroxylase superfamily)